MNTLCRFSLTATVIALAFASVTNASAAKKLSYEQAWEQCKKELDAAGLVGANTDAKARSTVGAGCMKKHGYRLKKSSMM